jgi:transposase
VESFAGHFQKGANKMTTHVQFTLGIDLAQASFDVAIAPTGTDPNHWRDLPNTHVAWPPDSPEGIERLVTWTAEQCDANRCVRIVVESTGQLSRRFAWALKGRGLPDVSIVNPRRTKAFGDSLGVREKTDRIECAILAIYGLVHRPKPTRLRSRQAEQLRELVRLRQSYVEERTRWQNRLGEANEPPTRKMIERSVKHMDRQIRQLNEQIDEQIDEDPQMSFQVCALKQIKGIGPVTARTLTAELGDLRVYSRNQLVSLAGLFPKRHESGRSVRRRPRLAKGGGGRLRRVLYMCATALFNSKGPLRCYIERKRGEGFEDMCIEAMVMRKLLIIARAVMVNGGVYDPSKICPMLGVRA